MAREGTEPPEGGRAFTPGRASRFIVAGALCALLLLSDRLSKRAVLSTIALTGETVEFIPGVLSFRYVTNTGAAFSLGEGMGFVFVVLALAFAAAAVWYLAREPKVSWPEVVGLGMVVGGAAGNAIDRVVYGYVVDFIATEFIDFPVFNIADIGVTVGIAITLLAFLFLNPASNEEDGSPTEDGAPGADSREACGSPEGDGVPSAEDPSSLDGGGGPSMREDR